MENKTRRRLNDKNKRGNFHYLHNNDTINIGTSGIGGSIARFNDSFNKASMWAMVTGECVKPFKYVSVGLGVGVGHLQTSHYKGGFGALYGKIKNPQTGLYIKIMPQPFSNNRIDSFTAVTLGISKEF